MLDTLGPKSSAAELDRIAEQIHGTKPTPPPVAPQKVIATQPKTMKKASPAPPPKMEGTTAQHRLTIDLPKWLVEQIRLDGKKNGVTVRGVILGHLLNIYNEK